MVQVLQNIRPQVVRFHHFLKTPADKPHEQPTESLDGRKPDASIDASHDRRKSSRLEVLDFLMLSPEQ